ncbi:MAG: hypothetical protein HXK89_02495 [Lachnospiraceae bacterium]|nr:hypothetical protein [Lachnospiraceae bacterium]
MDIDLDISFSRHRNRRSIDANAFLWACLGEIARAINSDTWSVYLYMLERYGKFTHILVKPEAVEQVRQVWRETKIVGEKDGMIQMLCFFGSSTYNTKEFSQLLDGVVSEMKEMHLETPPDEEMKRLLEGMQESDQRREQGKTGKSMQE